MFESSGKFIIVVATIVLSGTPALAQEKCEPILQIIHEAQTEFEDLYGDKIEIDAPIEFEAFQGTLGLDAESNCTLSVLKQNGDVFSTGYTCGIKHNDSETATKQLKDELDECLNVQQWFEQEAPGSPPTSIARYGLLRLTISQQDESLGFGVEVFRDKSGRIAGSSLRGDSVLPDGRHLCTPRPFPDLKASFERYMAQQGAEPFETAEFFGVRNREMSPTVAFLTRPIHPAHPAIIVRNIFEQDGSVSITAEGDFSGDCLAFHDLLADVRRMNESIGK